MEPRQIDQEEIVNIVVGVSDTLAKRLTDGAVIVPKLIRAALEFYQWLAAEDRVKEDESTSRDVIVGQMLSEMKKRV